MVTMHQTDRYDGLMRRSSEQQKARILDAAASAFAAAGFAGARVDAIAAAAGVNKRLLYHYVGAKDVLLSAVLEREAQRATAASLSDPGIWRLVLEEAAHQDVPRLLPALAACTSSESGLDSAAPLARAMFQALLPEFAAASAGLAGPTAAATVLKPRIRMQPQLTQPTRNDSNRSK